MNDQKYIFTEDRWKENEKRDVELGGKEERQDKVKRDRR